MPGTRVRSINTHYIGVISDDPLPNGFDVNGYVMVRWLGKEEATPEYVEFIKAS